MRSLQVSNQPWMSGHHWAVMEQIPSSPAGARGGVSSLVHPKWTLHKLCTLVQFKRSICELSYLMLRMKTSKRGGGVNWEKPMKIYWNYGKETDSLLYIDRIIFIKYTSLCKSQCGAVCFVSPMRRASQNFHLSLAIASCNTL